MRLANKGFTFIEMLVVITVLALVAVMVVPNLVSMKASRDRIDAISAIRRVAGDAREQAIDSGRTTQVTYDESTRELEIQQVGDDGNATTLRQTALPTDLEPQHYQLEGKDSTSVDFKLTFTPDGHSNGGGIEFQGFSIFVDPNGGYQYLDGPLPNPTDLRWEAGNLEQRTQ